MNKPLILLTNDDGIGADGLKALYESIKGYYRIAIVAPTVQRSGTGMGLTIHRAMEITPVEWEDKTPAWMVAGKPADCVKLGLRVLLEEKPAMVLSGINHGSNAGRCTLYSGTVGGAMEGAIQEIPGIAFSNVNETSFDLLMIKQFIPRIVAHYFEHPMPRGTIINVNFPDRAGQRIKGVKYTKQGLSYIGENPFQDEKTMGYYLSSKWLHFDEHEETDIAYLRDGYITATPLHADDMTDHDHYMTHKAQFEEIHNSEWNSLAPEA